MKINLVEEDVHELPRLKREGNKSILVLRLHGFDGKYVPHILKIVWIEGSDEITIKANEETLNEISKHIVKRDTPLNVVWSILQYEYKTLDNLEDKVEKLQNASLQDYSSKILRDILKVKKTLFLIHRDYMRMRNVLEWVVQKNESAGEILRDVNELIYGIEYLIDATTIAIQLMQNTLSVKMNQTMKILTIIATIMMPLTLITGIYGMNFVNMPEIKWQYGYYYSLSLMLAIALLMLYYFKRKKLL